MGLEVFAEGELFREAEFFRDFLDGEFRLRQQMFRLADCIGNNPLHRRLPGVLVDECREMPDCQVRCLRISGYRIPFGIMQAEGLHEPDEYLFTSGWLLVGWVIIYRHLIHYLKNNLQAEKIHQSLIH